MDSEFQCDYEDGEDSDDQPPKGLFTGSRTAPLTPPFLGRSARPMGEEAVDSHTGKPNGPSPTADIEKVLSKVEKMTAPGGGLRYSQTHTLSQPSHHTHTQPHTPHLQSMPEAQRSKGFLLVHSRT